MDLGSIDAALLSMGIVGEAILFTVLMRGRLYRSFPIFSAFILYLCLSDTVALVFRHISPKAYFVASFVSLAPDFLLQLGVLLEVGRNVVNPVKKSLPKSSLLVLAAMVVGGVLVGVLVSFFTKSSKLTMWSQYFVQINFTFAILRLVIFAVIAAFAQMLGIGWRNHVLQIATGIASYSVVMLLIELLHRFAGVTDDYQYHLQGWIGTVSWCVSLGYWSYFLSRKESARQEFSPKMAQFLISISGTAKQNRASAGRLYRK